MQRLRLTILAIVATIGIAGCGSETDGGNAAAPPASEESTSSPTEEPASPSATEPAAFDPATATLTDKPFCDDIEAAAAEGFLGLGNGQLDLVTSRTVGEKYQDAVGETTKSESNSCYYADTKQTAFVAVSVTPKISGDEVQARLDIKAEYDGGPGESDKCQVEQGPDLRRPERGRHLRGRELQHHQGPRDGRRHRLRRRIHVLLLGGDRPGGSAAGPGPAHA